MTTEWKRAIRQKKKAAKHYGRNRDAEAWQTMRKLRNEATRLRRKAVREYWRKKADDLRTKPQLFYKTFIPFLGSKRKCAQSTDIKLNIEGEVTKDQKEFAETLGNYFAKLADDIRIHDGRETEQDKKAIQVFNQ